MPAAASDASRPYAGLDPASVLDALAAVGRHGDGRLLQLNSYENRVWRIHLEDGDAVVAKFYRPGRWTDAQILEEHAFARDLQEAEVPVVAPLALHAEPGGPLLLGTPPTLATWRPGQDDTAPPHRFALTPLHGGRAPETDDPAVLERLGAFVGRLHAVGQRALFRHRARIDVASLGHAGVATLLAGNHVTPAEARAWNEAVTRALHLAETAFAACEGMALLRLHGDCHLGNILWREGHGAHFVDLDDAATGPAVQDLWMLLPSDAAERRARLPVLLRGYETFRKFDDREWRLVEPLRTLRMIRHSAWIAERWHDPAFPAAFPWFGTAAYWSQQTTQLREQIEAMDGG